MAKKKTLGKKRKATGSRQKREAPVGLTDQQRRELIKPPPEFDDAMNSIADAMENERVVRVPGLSAAKIRRMTKRAQSAWTREDEYRRQSAAKLRELEDARLLAEDAAWRAALDVWDMAKSVGRRRPEAREAFQFMERYIGGGGRPRPKPQPVEPTEES